MECTHVLAVVVGLAGAAEQLSTQQVPVVLQERQVQVSEELHVFVLHAQLFGRVPVDHLKKRDGVRVCGGDSLYRARISGVRGLTLRSDTSL